MAVPAGCACRPLPGVVAWYIWNHPLVNGFNPWIQRGLPPIGRWDILRPGRTGAIRPHRRESQSVYLFQEHHLADLQEHGRFENEPVDHIRATPEHHDS